MNLLWLMVIIGIIVGGFLALVVVAIVFLLSYRKKTTTAHPAENRTIDLDALPLPSLPPQTCSLDIYHSPTQLAVLVLAPLGRAHELPEKDQWRNLLEQLCPGFGDVLDEHQPVFRRWPPQMSHAGFYRSFFANMRSADAPHSPTRWYKVAGKVDWFNHQILVGMVARTSSKSPLAPIEVEHPGKWREILKKGMQS
jgi:hypothetical protein